MSSVSRRFSTLVTVNLSMLARNIERVRVLAPKAKLCPMVKGDAYGHGIVKISEYLVKHCGISRLGVASLGEALCIYEQLPELASNPNVEIVVFSDTELQNKSLRQVYTQYSAKIYPVVATLPDLNAMLTEEDLLKLPLFLKVNTGKNRLGIRMHEVEGVAERIREKRGRIDLLLQHFSTSYLKHTPGDTTSQQYARFKEIRKSLEEEHCIPVLETSVANSGAIEQGVGVEETWVRPGLMIYGCPSVTEPEVLYNGEYIANFKTKVVKTYTLTDEDTPFIGYGFNKVEATPCFVCILPVGYADGFLRYNTGMKIRINGVVGQVHGLVNMDLTQVVFYPHKCGKTIEELEKLIKQEDSVAIWSHNAMDIVKLADTVNTNCYQLMCALTTRVPRDYIIE